MTELATLQSILALEKARGYDNGAVIGGLDAFLRRAPSEGLSLAERRAV